MTGDDSENGWNEYRRMVIDKLNTLTTKVDQLTNDVANLKGKAGVWGALGGIIFGGLISWLFSKK